MDQQNYKGSLLQDLHPKMSQQIGIIIRNQSRREIGRGKQNLPLSLLKSRSCILWPGQSIDDRAAKVLGMDRANSAEEERK